MLQDGPGQPAAAHREAQRPQAVAMVGPDLPPLRRQQGPGQKRVVRLQALLQHAGVLVGRQKDGAVLREDLQVSEHVGVQTPRDGKRHAAPVGPRIREHLVDEAEVGGLQDVVAGGDVGVQIRLVVEGLAAADEVGADQVGAGATEDVQQAEQALPADRASGGDRAWIGQPGQTDLVALKLVGADEPDSGMRLPEAHHPLQALRQQPVVGRDELAPLRPGAIRLAAMLWFGTTATCWSLV